LPDAYSPRRAGRLALTLAVAAPAGAVCTEEEVADSTGVQMWRAHTDGGLEVEYRTGGGPSDQSGYDPGHGMLSIDGPDADTTFSPYAPGAGPYCTSEENGRELVLPPRTVDGVEVTRKVYFPTTGLAFARQVDILENPGFNDVLVRLRWHGSLNADDKTTVERTSSGDMTVTVGDQWAAFWSTDAPNGNDLAIASLWDGSGGPDGFDAFGPDGAPGAADGFPDQFDLDYTNVVIPALGRAVFMHIEHAALSDPDQQQFAQTHAGNMAAFTAGMEPAELEALRNWPVFDRDGDGILEGADNCRSTPNPTQADLDGDGAGDACDPDDDADGLPDSAEPGLGTDPRRADSDGDGLADGADQCPTLAGSGTGCPSTAAVVRETPRELAKALGLESRVTARRRSRGRLLTVRGRLRLPAGVEPAQACTRSPLLIAATRRGRRVGSAIARLRSDCSYTATLRLAGRTGRVTVVLEFPGNSFVAAVTRRLTAPATT
jgi:Thrombospondin type 3 repeat